MWGVRAGLFFFEATRHFTKEAFLARQKHFDPSDLEVSLSGQHHMITGANQGIGYETALFVAKKGATVHLVCRNTQRGEEARAKIAAETGNDQVFLHICDVSMMQDVSSLAHAYLKTGNPLHVLVHNAGCMVAPFTKTSEGVEVNFAANLAGPVLLTELLLPVLRKTDKSRVIMVSSGGMYTETLELEDLYGEKFQPFSEMRQYARNKRQQIAVAEHWAAQRENAGVLFLSMHPGWADTDAARTKMSGLYKRYKDSFRTPLQGADTVIWLAASTAAGRMPSGAFFLDRQPVSKHLTLAGTGYATKDVEALYEKVTALLRPYLHDAGSAAAAASAL